MNNYGNISLMQSETDVTGSEYINKSC